ncbi:MAG: helix-turn-helix domain containing protein [Sideroxydans sp.]|nr:helix-turn-helix domain containing protein [Sideroxydans sp.]
MMTTAEKITHSALQLFYRQGFHATGVAQLSQAAGVTKKTLYSYFASKDLLVAAALQLRHEQFSLRMQVSVEAQAVHLRPLAYIEFIINWVQQADFYGCAFINAAAEYAELNASPHLLAKTHKQNLTSYLAELCRAAHLNQADLVAGQLFLLGEGLIVACQVNGVAEHLLQATRATALLLVAK